MAGARRCRPPASPDALPAPAVPLTTVEVGRRGDPARGPGRRVAAVPARARPDRRLRMRLCKSGDPCIVQVRATRIGLSRAVAQQLCSWCPRRRRAVAPMSTAVLSAAVDVRPAAAAAVRRVALIGNPNTGKTTLFNALCGARAKTSNFPGTTTAVRTGHSDAAGWRARGARPARGLRPRRRHARVARSPAPCSAARAVTRPMRSSSSSMRATCRATSCSSASCWRARRGSCVALNMVDLAARRGLVLDADGLARAARRAGRADRGAQRPRARRAAAGAACAVPAAASRPAGA